MTEARELTRSKWTADEAVEDEVRRLLVEAGPRPPVPAEDLSAIRAAARAEWSELAAARRARRSALVVPALAAAASLLVALAVGWWWLANRPSPAPVTIATVELIRGAVRVEGPAERRREGPLELAVGEALVAGAELATVAGSQGTPSALAVRLAGGQSLRLDAGSRVRIESETRIELRRGAVYVDSGPDPDAERAVTVATAYGEVYEIGTQFEVRLEEGKTPHLRVRVREGEVSVRWDGEVHPAARGEELTVAADGSVSRADVDPFGPVWDWILVAAPGLPIDGVLLPAYLEWVARETGWTVQYADAELARSAAGIRVYGSIEGVAPDESLGVVLPGSGLAYRLEEPVLWVERPRAETGRQE